MGLRYRHAMNLAYAAVAACVALGACVDGPTSTSPVASALELSRALVPLGRFGIGHGGAAMRAELRSITSSTSGWATGTSQ